MSASASHAALIAEIAALRASLANAIDQRDAAELERPKCGECGAVAVCLGRSLDPPETATEWLYGCDECCGHGDEEGECVPLDGIPKRVTRLQKQTDNTGATTAESSGLHPSQSSGAGDRQPNGQAGPVEIPHESSLRALAAELAGALAGEEDGGHACPYSCRICERAADALDRAIAAGIKPKEGE